MQFSGKNKLKWNKKPLEQWTIIVVISFAAFPSISQLKKSFPYSLVSQQSVSATISKHSLAHWEFFQLKNNASCYNFYRKYKFLYGEERILAKRAVKFLSDSCLMFYYWFILWKTAPPTRQKQGPILWMQLTGRIHLCKFYAKAATKKPNPFRFFLSKKILPNFQDCKIFIIELHWKLITKLIIIFTSAIRIAPFHFHTTVDFKIVSLYAQFFHLSWYNRHEGFHSSLRRASKPSIIKILYF